MIAGIVGKAASTVITGAVGAAAYDGIKQAARSGAVREGAVTALAWGLRGKRRAEAGAEQVRLTTGDLVAEARQRVGEQAPPPGTPESHQHDH